MSQSCVVRIIDTLVCAVVLCTLVFASGQKSLTKLSDLPAEAQSGVSAALGGDIPEYRARATHDGYEVANPRQKLNARFGSRGLEVQAESTRFGMSVRGYGYGTALTHVRQARPIAASNHVEYRRGSFTEWYVNGPMGLEQGFTLSRRPGKANGRMLTITLGLSGNLKAVADSSGTSLKLSRSMGDAVMRYAGLTALDASGKELAASLRVDDRELRLEIDDSSARYPISVDPTISNFTLTASDGVSGDIFGYSVAIVGNTVVVGAAATTVNGNQYQGTAYVFVKPTSGWANMTQTAELTASDGQGGDNFGRSVAISGNTVVVGSPQATVNGNQDQGAVYVFVKPAKGWNDMHQTAKLVASDGVSFAYLGTATAFSGNTIVAGAQYSSDQDPGPGKAYVFVEPIKGGWTNGTQTAELTASNGAPYDYFGYAVAVDSNTVIVGGGLCGGECPGTAYVYVEPASGWANMTETAQLTPSDGGGEDFFASSVSTNGSTTVVGAPYHEFDEAGAVYVFVESAGGWVNMTQTAELTVNATTSQCLGSSVSISGGVILAGADCVHDSTGAAYVFVKPANGWENSSTFALKLSIPFKYQWDHFGASVAISGKVGVIGASYAPTSPPCQAGKCEPGPGEAFLFTEQ
jgi:hypothetical protein